MPEDEIVWETERPPPKNWAARHKAGEALGDPAAHMASVADDIQTRGVVDQVAEDYLSAADDYETVMGAPPDVSGLKTTTGELTRNYNGNPLVDPQIIPKYT